MAIEQPIILMGAMLSPKAMAHPTIMMARLAVFATECLQSMGHRRVWRRLARGTRGQCWPPEACPRPKCLPTGPASAPPGLSSRPGESRAAQSRQARPEHQEPNSGIALVWSGWVLSVLRCVTPEIVLSARVETSLYK